MVNQFIRLPATYDSAVTAQGNLEMVFTQTAAGRVSEVFTPSQVLAMYRDAVHKLMPGATVSVIQADAKGILEHPKISPHG